MLDHAEKWLPLPDWQKAVLERPGLVIRSLPALSLHLVSGNLEAVLFKLQLADAVGAWGLAQGERHAVRLAFDRMLVVGAEAGSLPEGWHEEGYAVTDVSGGLHVFEIGGDRLAEIMARGTSINLADPGPSATLLFAGMTASLYRHGDGRQARLAVNRAQAAALWAWFAAQDLADA